MSSPNACDSPAVRHQHAMQTHRENAGRTCKYVGNFRDGIARRILRKVQASAMHRDAGCARHRPRPGDDDGAEE